MPLCISSKGHNHRHLVQKLSLEIVAVQAPPVMIPTLYFPEQDQCNVNGMYAVTCGYQFSPGYRNVSIAVTCRYDFQGHICRIKIRFNLYIVKGT